MTAIERIWTKVERDGVGSLPESERLYFWVHKFLHDFENGGFSGFLYNMSPSVQDTAWADLRAVADALTTIGDVESAELLLQTADLLERSTSTAPEWGEFLASSGLAECVGSA